MKISNLRAKFKPKGCKGNIHFGKVVLTLMLVCTMVLGNIETVEANGEWVTITSETGEMRGNIYWDDDNTGVIESRSTVQGYARYESTYGRGTIYTKEVDKQPIYLFYRTTTSESSSGEYTKYKVSLQGYRQLLLPTTPSSITVPTTIRGGESIIISWGSSSNATRYHLERQVDNGAWVQIYSGYSLNYIDSITKGWNTVTYRVRAYNSDGYSDYRTSPTRNVINNSSPILTISTPTENSYFV